MFGVGKKAEGLAEEKARLVVEALFAKKLAAFMSPLKVAGEEVLNAIKSFNDPGLAKGMLRRAGENLDASTKLLNEAIRILEERER